MNNFQALVRSSGSEIQTAGMALRNIEECPGRTTDPLPEYHPNHKKPAKKLHYSPKNNNSHAD
jgi:hypothetical protein